MKEYSLDIDDVLTHEGIQKKTAGEGQAAFYRIREKNDKVKYLIESIFLRNE